MLAIGAASRGLHDLVRALASNPHDLVCHRLDRRALLRGVIRLVPFDPKALVSLAALKTPGCLDVSVAHLTTFPAKEGTARSPLALVGSNRRKDPTGARTQGPGERAPTIQQAAVKRTSAPCT